MKQLLKQLIRFATFIYFRKIIVLSKTKLPKNVPLILAPNHPSAFLDPLLIASIIQRNVYFITRGESFKNKLISRIFKHLQMIPIFRPEYSPDQVNQNEFVFSKCHEVFNEGDCVMIFPEGLSKTESRLRKVKTGAARMALSYTNPENLLVVPISINYMNPHRFQTDVLIEINNPIALDEYVKMEQEESFSGVKALTTRLEGDIKEGMIIQEMEALDDIEKEMKSLIIAHHLYALPNTKPVDCFHQVNKAANFLNQLEEDNLTRLKLVNAYQAFKRQKADLKLSNRDLFLFDKKINFGTVLSMIIGVFPAIFGFLAYVVPFKITEWSCNLLVKRADFRGAVLVVLGMFVFLFYELAVLLYLIKIGLALNYILAIMLIKPFCGLFAYYFFRWMFSLLKINKLKRHDLKREEVITMRENVHLLFKIIEEH